MRLMLRGCRRMGQPLSQALPCAYTWVWQVRQSRARSRSNDTTMPLGLAIQARLWNKPTAQPKRQNRWRANANSKVKTTVATTRKRA